MSKKKIVTTEILEPIDEDAQKEEKTERKIDRLFKELRGSEEGFELTLYKVKDRGKSRVEKYYNEVPDLSTIRDTWGGGKYAIYCTYSDGRYDYAEIELEGLPEKAKKSDTRETILQEIKAMKEIIAPQSQDNQLLIEIMKMNQAAIENQNKMIMQINEKFSQMQLESEKRLLSVLQNQKSNLTEIMQMIDFIDSIRGNSGESPSLLEKLLSAPAVQQTIAGMIAPSEATSAIAPSFKISEKFSKNFIDFVTPDTKQKAIEMVTQKLKCATHEAEKIINQILKEKGAA